MKSFNLNPVATPTIEGVVRWIRSASVDLNSHIRETIPNLESQSSDFTTERSTRVVATAAITITLNATPADQETVTVKRATSAGSVVVDGNGNTIDGSSNFTLLNNYDSYTFVYFENSSEWLII